MTTLYDYEALQKENDTLRKHMRKLLELLIDPHEDMRGEGYYHIMRYCNEQKLIVNNFELSTNQTFINEEMFK